MSDQHAHARAMLRDARSALHAAANAIRDASAEERASLRPEAEHVAASAAELTKALDGPIAPDDTEG